MAITAKLRMKVRDVRPAVGGRPEVVELVEVHDPTVANTNLHRMPTSMPNPADALVLTIDAAVAQGSFVKGRHYVTEFTLIDPPDSIV